MHLAPSCMHAGGGAGGGGTVGGGFGWLIHGLALGCELYMYMLRARLMGAWVLSVCGCGTRGL